jgi:hypothetical protein
MTKITKGRQRPVQSEQYDSSLRRLYHLGKVVGWGAGEEVTVGFHQREQPEEGVLGGQEESVSPVSWGVGMGGG